MCMWCVKICKDRRVTSTITTELVFTIFSVSRYYPSVFERPSSTHTFPNSTLEKEGPEFLKRGKLNDSIPDGEITVTNATMR